MDINKFSKLPLMGILRGAESDIIEPLIEAVIDAGLETLEITMNTRNAAEIIEKSCAIAGARLEIGAGTVLSVKDLDEAINAGASYIVMPATIDSVMERCEKDKIPVFPGALTPGEVLKTWQGGAAMVKIFPSGLFGPRYFKELKGPYDNVKLIAVGGVNADNVGEYFACGADAVAFGGSIFTKDRLASHDFASIGKDIRILVDLCKVCGEVA